MELVSFVVALALLEYFIFGLLVGKARSTYGVEAPATSGHPIFDRTMRAQQNTMEQLVVFVPSMYAFGHFLSSGLAALLGILFIIGRLLYFRGYVEDAKKRSAGFALSVVPQIILLVGSLVASGIAAF